MGLSEARGGGSLGLTVDPQTKVACLDGRREAGKEGGGAGRAGAQPGLFRAERLAGSPTDTPTPITTPSASASFLLLRLLSWVGPPPSPQEQKPPSGLVYGRKVNKSFHFWLLPWVCRDAQGGVSLEQNPGKQRHCAASGVAK